MLAWFLVGCYCRGLVVHCNQQDAFEKWTYSKPDVGSSAVGALGRANLPAIEAWLTSFAFAFSSFSCCSLSATASSRCVMATLWAFVISCIGSWKSLLVLIVKKLVVCSPCNSWKGSSQVLKHISAMNELCIISCHTGQWNGLPQCGCVNPWLRSPVPRPLKTVLRFSLYTARWASERLPAASQAPDCLSPISHAQLPFHLLAPVQILRIPSRASHCNRHVQFPLSHNLFCVWRCLGQLCHTDLKLANMISQHKRVAETLFADINVLTLEDCFMASIWDFRLLPVFSSVHTFCSALWSFACSSLICKRHTTLHHQVQRLGTGSNTVYHRVHFGLTPSQHYEKGCTVIPVCGRKWLSKPW